MRSLCQVSKPNGPPELVLTASKRSKIRCSGQRPACTSCSRRGTPCLYDRELSSHVGTVSKANDWNTPVWDHDDPSSRVDLTQTINTGSGSREDVEATSDPTMANLVPEVFAGFDFSGPFFEASIQNGFDWMFNDNYTTPLSSVISRPGQEQQWNSFQTPQSEEVTLTYGNAVFGQQIPLQSESPLDSLHIPSANQEEETEDRWPIFWRPEALSISALASLGNSEDVLSHQIFHNLPVVNLNHMKAFTELLGVPSDKWLWSGVDMSSFPSGKKLDHCIDRYFVHFDKVNQSHHTELKGKVSNATY